MDRYPPIAAHGLVGDLQTGALVSAEGVVDWFTAPRFDFPSIFAALLAHDRGGLFRLSPDDPACSRKQLYYPDTAVLVTRFMPPDGVGEVLDWMVPLTLGAATARHTLFRTVRVVRGTVRFSMECRPRFDYGRASHTLEINPRGASFRSAGTTCHLSTGIPLEREGDDVHGAVTLTSGQAAAAVFTVCGADESAPAPLTVDGVTEQLWETVDFWQRWLRTSCRTACAARRAPSASARSSTSTPWPGRAAAARPVRVREDAHLRQPRRPLRRGDRPQR